jgi:serine protease
LMQGSLSEDDSLVQIPVVMIEQELGQSLVSQLARGTAVQASVTTAPSDYASFDGTSMATPHVAGVVALMKAANPDLRPARVRSILAQTARRLAPNDTNQLGAGVVQADQAVRRAARY